MKKIALITTNNILAQSLAATIKTTSKVEFDFFLFLNYDQALLDAEIFEIDVALIDVMAFNSKEKPLSFLLRMHENMPNCRLLLLVSQEDKVSRKIASQAKQMKIIDDFVFYDASLKYLFAKLAAF